MESISDFFLSFSEDGSLIPIYHKLNSVPNYLKTYYKMVKQELYEWDDIKNKSDFLRDDILINLCTLA